MMARWQWVLIGLGGLILAAVAAGVVFKVERSPIGGEIFKLLLLAGILISAGIMGRRTPTAFQKLSFIIFNVFMWLLIIELICVVLMRVLFGGVSFDDPRPQYAYYQAQAWGDQYWADAARVEHIYRPYVTWGREALVTETINADERGHRVTPGAECSAEAYTIYMMGGSTMWGVGAPDWETIPAHLQAIFAAQHEEPVCVINFGEEAYVSTQEVIQLMLELRDGRIPDLVIFYDGINENVVGYQTQAAGDHQNMADIRRRFENSNTRLLEVVLRQSHTLGLLAFSLGANKPADPLKDFTEADFERLAGDITQVYAGNYRLVEALAAEYGFEFYFFWQPVSVTTDKPLAEDETDFPDLLRVPDSLVPLVTLSYAEVSALDQDEYPHLYNLQTVFDGEPDAIYIDWMHLNPVGNQMVAARMAEIIAAAGE